MINDPYQNQPILIVEQTGQVFLLGQELVTIGRKTGNTIVLGQDLKASRHHTAIAWDNGTYIVKDVSSSNGTFVNNQRITEPRPLANNDVIRVGDTTFRVKLPAAQMTPSALPDTDRPGSPLTKRQPTDTIITPPPPVDDNPYVGPRTFSQQEADRFFGREVEARELLSLIIAERLVLFYAQSGAGKSSLINTRLIPQLREANYAVLPVGRVSGEVPKGAGTVENIYLFNLLLSLDESDGDPQRFTRMSLSHFLKNLTSLDGQHYYYDDAHDDILETNEWSEPDTIFETDEFYEDTPYVLIIDQFEEIVTTHPGRWQEREGFFQQLEQAMTADPFLWVVLTLREDYIAPLDPYMHVLPGKMRARFYMQRMKHEAALAAVKNPAAKYGRPFVAGVAEELVNNLRQIRSHMAPDQTETGLGEFVEPVQLQVVCYQLWENLKHRPLGKITRQDLSELGDVDKALAKFYEQALAKVIEQTSVSEIDLRNWFETQLITEAGTRGTVYRGLEQTGRIPNQVVDLLQNQFILRSEAKAGGTWYELVHDRFVSPILQANQIWRLDQPLIQMAQSWSESNRSVTKLLEGPPLQDALDTNWQGLGKQVRAFLEASQTAQRAKNEALRQHELEQARALAEEQRKRAELQVEAAAKLRRRAWWLGIFFIAAVLMTIIATYSSYQATSNFREAVTAQASERMAQQTATASLEEAAGVSAEKQVIQDNFKGYLATQEVNVQAEYDTVIGYQTATAIFVASAPLATPTAGDDGTEVLTPPTTDTVTAAQTTPITAEETPLISEIVLAEPNGTPPLAITVEALEAKQTAIRATREAINVIPSPTPTATPTPIPTRAPLSCDISPQGELAPAWEQHKKQLGCPIQAQPIGGLFVEQSFERGFMVWTEALDVFLVAVGNESFGEWQLVTRADFNPAGAGCEPSLPKSSPELVQPILGFGGVWCQFPEIQRKIGFGTQPEYGVREPALLQQFENGFIYQDSKRWVFVLFLDTGTYLRAG